MVDAVVKIDGKLLKDVGDFINREDNKLIYANKRQFVNIAVLEKLENCRKIDQKRGKITG